MTEVMSGLSLTAIIHEDLPLAVARLRDGWGEDYARRAAVLRLSKADWEALGLEGDARIELTTPAGSVVVTAKLDNDIDAGLAFMPASLYTNRLTGSEPGSLQAVPRRIHVTAMPADKAVTPVTDLMVRRNRA